MRFIFGHMCVCVCVCAGRQVCYIMQGLLYWWWWCGEARRVSGAMCTGAVIFSSYLRARTMAKTNQRCVVVSSAAAQQPTPHNRCIVLLYIYGVGVWSISAYWSLTNIYCGGNGAHVCYLYIKCTVTYVTGCVRARRLANVLNDRAITY